MAITTYAQLQDAVEDFLARTDLSLKIPDFIALAESRLSRSIRAKDMQTSSTIALSSGAATLPADYEEWISCRFVGSAPAVTQDLGYAEPDSAEWRFRFRPNGQPQMFTIMAGSIEIRPSGTGNVKLYYYKTLISEALSDSNPSNWLLDKAPDVYLYSTIAEAHVYLKDEERAGEFLALAKQEADKESIAADMGKLKNDPLRAIDAGAGTARAAGGGGAAPQVAG